MHRGVSLGARARTGKTSFHALVFVLVYLAPCAAQSPAPTAQPKNADIDSQRVQLQGVADTLAASQAQRAKIEAEIAKYKNDRAALNSALIETTAKINEASAKQDNIEKRLETLTGSETAIRRSLESRNGVLVEVLAALQRMGRRPPPALLVRPEDMLLAIRTSMLLGAVLPQLRSETQALAADLNDLIALRKSISEERAGLAREIETQKAERQRLAALIDARQSAQAVAEKVLDSERARAAELARQATSLQELIGKMEGELSGAKRAAEQAKSADEAHGKLSAREVEEARARFAERPLRDPARLAPAIAFDQAKGLLSLPVNGVIIKRYGIPDNFGGIEKGISIATRPHAIVSAPSDGFIAFAGPWRSYGQLLIVNAGAGYYIVLAGAERIDVAVGQFVLAGEPLASMGDGASQTAATIAIGSGQPVLYVEFRKDGAAIDPGPWWAKPDIQKVRG